MLGKMILFRERARLVSCEIKTKSNVPGKSSPALALDSMRDHNRFLLLLKRIDHAYDVKEAYLRGTWEETELVVFLRPPSGLGFYQRPIFR